MDLGIAGRKAIVCASSRGLGKACAARAGRSRLRGGDQRPRRQDGWTPPPPKSPSRPAPRSPLCRRRRHAGRPEGAARRLPYPDILINNNAGPPMRDFRELTRQQMIDGVIANMIVAVD